MSLPYFYIERYDPLIKEIILDEDNSRHVVQVLRMKPGARLNLTDGQGNVLTTVIKDDHKKKCVVSIESTATENRQGRKVSIGISLLKSANRFEWFLEKATELGITEIIPLICERTESEKFRNERMHAILVSAMLQSQQSWLPVLHEPIAYELLFRQEEVATVAQKFIAHCVPDARRPLQEILDPNLRSRLLLIGPEGDFTPGEVGVATRHHFQSVSLGVTRLRTETAGIVAATMLQLG